MTTGPPPPIDARPNRRFPPNRILQLLLVAFAAIGFLTVALAAAGLYIQLAGIEDFSAATVVPVRPAAPVPEHLKQIGGAFESESDIVPIDRVDPLYPEVAASCGVQGWVVVGFDVNSEGAVSGAEVVESSPRGMFDAAAVDAISEWVYEPAKEGGKPIPRPDVKVLLRFQLDQ